MLYLKSIPVVQVWLCGGLCRGLCGGCAEVVRELCGIVEGLCRVVQGLCWDCAGVVRGLCGILLDTMLFRYVIVV